MQNLSHLSAARLRRTRHALLKWLLRQEQQHDQVANRLRILACIGCIGMPLYYLVWTVWFPQEFESFALRGLGMALCLGALLVPKFCGERWQRVYEFVGVTYMLPFFFTFMFLMNHGSAVWCQSLLVALIVLFHFDWPWALASFACGSAIAGAAFVHAGDAAFLASPTVVEQLPIYGFTILVVSVSKVGRRVLAREKLAGMSQALAMVSHELRTPLISVSANVRGIERSALFARRVEDDCPEQRAVSDAMARIQFEVRHMNQMIDLFLHSAAAMNQQLTPGEQVSMSGVVASVIERYPFAAQAQRERVRVVVRGDFTFTGKHELGVVLVLNLLRNALKALQRAGRGQVRIIVDGTRARPQLRVLDSGCGIPARQLPYIFERFYSYPPSSGSGIGLALCKDIVDAWQGRIRCRSRELAYTVFALEFPPAGPPATGAPC